MRHKIPMIRSGQVVGLLGGSFDPAHMGHVHISRAALRHLGLDQLWWLVSPQNPLKPNAPRSLQDRLSQARQIMQHPRVKVTALETHLGTTHTAQTIAALQHLYPGVRFVWLMGADNMRDFHHWKGWKTIVARVPIAIFARRPDGGGVPHMGKIARIYPRARLSPKRRGALITSPPPRWMLIPLLMHQASSSAIRKQGGW